MATNESDDTRPSNAEPAARLPEESVLELEDYLEMHKAIGNPTRYRILRLLVADGEMSPTEIEAELGIDDSTIHYHLNKLHDAHLIRKWMQSERGQDGTHVYYSATIYGRTTLQAGVQTLIEGEHEFHDMYADSAASDS